MPHPAVHPDVLAQIRWDSAQLAEQIQNDTWTYPPASLLQRFAPLPGYLFRHSVPSPLKAKVGHDDRYHKGEKPFANPRYAASRAAAFFRDLWTADGSLRAGFWNVEFGNKSKAERYASLYELVVAAHGILGLIECDVAFAKAIAGSTHSVYSADVNSRGQGNHILVRSDLKVKESFQIGEVADIQGIPDLRPPIVVVVTLMEVDYLFSVTHNKSMRQGQKETEPARLEQNEKHIRRLRQYSRRIVQGDLNTRLDASHPDTRPFEDAGLKRYPANDNRATNKHGNPIDGIYRDSSVLLDMYDLGLGEDFWNDSDIGTSISDHALVTYVLQGVMPSKAEWLPAGSYLSQFPYGAH